MTVVVGVTGGNERAVGVARERIIYGAEDTYLAAIHRAGAASLVIPLVPGVAEAVDRVDALLLTGGPDIDPSLYGARQVHPAVLTSTRDSPELALLEGALVQQMPVLGICRGLQLLAVYFGGRLHQHLPDVLGHSGHDPGDAQGKHDIEIVSGSRLSSMFGLRRTVNSQHHQGVDYAGALSVTAISSDGLIEGVEKTDSDFVVGVQWHPERRLQDGRLFDALVAAAAHYHDQLLHVSHIPLAIHERDGATDQSC